MFRTSLRAVWLGGTLAAAGPTRVRRPNRRRAAGPGSPVVMDRSCRWRLTGRTIHAMTGLTGHEVPVVESSVGRAKTLQIAPISIDVYEFEKH